MFEKRSTKTVQVTIEIPVGERHGYVHRSVSVEQLSVSQRETLNRVTQGLHHEDAHLENGRYFASANAANGGTVRWLLEAIGRELQRLETVEGSGLPAVAGEAPGLPGMDQLKVR